MRNMKKIVMLISMLLLPILAGCAGVMGGGRPNLWHSNSFTAGNISEVAVASPTVDFHDFNKGDVKQTVKGMPINTADILAPILHDAMKSMNFQVGEITPRDSNLGTFPDKKNFKGYTVSVATYLENDSDAMVNIKVEFFIYNKERKLISISENQPKNFKKYTDRIFLDEVMLSGPDSQAKVNAALAQKYKNIVPQIVTDLVGLKLEL